MSNKCQKSFPFRFYFSACFLVAVFFLFLDANYRMINLISFFSFFRLLKNTSVIIVFLGLCSIFLAIILKAIEYVFAFLTCRFIYPFFSKSGNFPGNGKGWLNSLKKSVLFSCVTSEGDGITYKPGSLPAFLLYFLFVYINLTYFKFFIKAASRDINSEFTKEVRIIVPLLLLSIPVYSLFLEKRLDFKKAKTFLKKFYKVAAVICISAFLFTTGFYIFDLRNPTGKADLSNPGNPGTAEKPDVIIVTFDSMNRKHMSVYGYSRNTTPNMKKFADECFVFQNMLANSNTTYFSLACILGKYPRWIGSPDIIPSQSLVNVLKNKGYDERYYISYNSLFRSGALIRGEFTEIILMGDFDTTSIADFLYRGRNRRNFQWLSSLLSESREYYNILSIQGPRNFTGGEKQLPVYFKFALKKLRNSSSPAFVWVHTFEPHTPYRIPEKFRSHYGNTMNDLYDGAISYADYQFGKFLEQLKKENLYENSLIIVSSDHGESHGEPIFNGEKAIGHSADWINDVVLQIPLLIHLPGQKFRKDPLTFAEHVDIAPTILEILNIKIPSWMEGESLVKYMQNPNLLSRKFKICVPYSHFLRQKVFLNAKPWNWIFVNSDVLFAHWYRYKIGWLQIYGPEKKGKWIINEPIGFDYFCLYDVFEDPDQSDNLVDDPRFKGLLSDLYNSPLLRYYWDYTRYERRNKKLEPIKTMN